MIFNFFYAHIVKVRGNDCLFPVQYIQILSLERYTSLFPPFLYKKKIFHKESITYLELAGRCCILFFTKLT